MVSIFRRRGVVCQQAVELVTDYLEGALPPRDRARFERHLRDCPHCTEYLAQIRAVMQTAARVTADDLPPEIVDEFVALYHRWRTD